MSKKVIKYFFELVFIFIIPLLILVINCNYENTIEYDNNGNFQSTEKHIEFTPPFDFTNGYVNVINDFNIWNEEWELGGISASTGEDYYSSNTIRSVGYTKVQSNTTYYFKSPYWIRILWYDVDYNFISYDEAINDTDTSPSTSYYMRFCGLSAATTYNNDICINVSVSWANGNYVPFGSPLVLITNTDVSGQNTKHSTVWGRLKNVFVDGLELQDNFVIDFIISYTILWFIMFIIWHIIYLLFDKLFHIRKE